MGVETDSSIGDEPIRRTAHEEVEDQELAVKNLVNGAYEDWPCEAGFDNLDEHRGPIEVPVQGTIPTWAAGTLFRTGPGRNKVEGSPLGQDDGNFYISHWFDGLAHTHRFDIIADDSDNGKAKVTYSSRRQSDHLAEHIQKKGYSGIISFAQKADPCIGVFGKFMSAWVVANNLRATKRLENLSVTVQTDVPGFSSLNDPPLNPDLIATASGHRPNRPTVWLASDTHTMLEIDAKTLEPIGLARQVTIHPSLTGPLSCAHAQRCPKTGDWFNFNLTTGPMPTYRVFRVSAATGETDILATISKPGLKITYIHSFFLSERFLVLRLPSSHISAYGLSILWQKNILDAMEPFDESKKCKWFVIDRHHGKGVVAEFETPAAFFFHTVNCFDELVTIDGEGQDLDEHDGQQMADIFCDVIDYPTTDVMQTLYYDVLINRDNKARTMWGEDEKVRRSLVRLVRWKLRVPVPCASSAKIDASKPTSRPGLFHKASHPARIKEKLEIQVPEEVLSIPGPHSGDLPTINPAFHTRRNRYIFALATRGKSTFVDTIVKTDVVTREALQWNNPHGYTPGEAIFVARPVSDGGSGEEDDGVLLSLVLDGLGKTSYLVCLDAKTMRELGRSDMGFAVGMGFHGVHTTANPRV